MTTSRERIALALSILNNAEGHEDRAVTEAMLALDGVTLSELAKMRGRGPLEPNGVTA